MKIEKTIRVSQSEIELEISNDTHETFTVLFEFQEWLETGNHEEPWAGLYVSAPGFSKDKLEIVAIFFGHPAYDMVFAEIENREVVKSE